MRLWLDENDQGQHGGVTETGKDGENHQQSK